MAAKLLAPRWFARAIKGGNEENVLCQVDANCHRLVHGLLLSPFGSSRCIASISWRIDAVEGRGRRPSHRALAGPRHRAGARRSQETRHSRRARRSALPGSAVSREWPGTDEHWLVRVIELVLDAPRGAEQSAPLVLQAQAHQPAALRGGLVVTSTGAVDDQ